MASKKTAEKGTLEYHRNELKKTDEEIITRIFTRNKISEEIAKIKFAQNLKIKQPETRDLFIEVRNKKIKKLHLHKKPLNKIFELINNESIRIQKNVFKKLKNDQKQH